MDYRWWWSNAGHRGTPTPGRAAQRPQVSLCDGAASIRGAWRESKLWAQKRGQDGTCRKPSFDARRRRCAHNGDVATEASLPKTHKQCSPCLPQNACPGLSPHMPADALWPSVAMQTRTSAITRLWASSAQDAELHDRRGTDAACFWGAVQCRPAGAL